MSVNVLKQRCFGVFVSVHLGVPTVSVHLGVPTYVHVDACARGCLFVCMREHMPVHTCKDKEMCLAVCSLLVSDNPAALED